MPTSCLPQLLPHRSRAVGWGQQPCWPHSGLAPAASCPCILHGTGTGSSQGEPGCLWRLLGGSQAQSPALSRSH